MQCNLIKAKGEGDSDDWKCEECGNLNFGWRTECNSIKCRSQRGGVDWTCPECGNTNFGWREKCNGKTCGAPKPENLPGKSVSCNVCNAI